MPLRYRESNQESGTRRATNRKRMTTISGSDRLQFMGLLSNKVSCSVSRTHIFPPTIKLHATTADGGPYRDEERKGQVEPNAPW